MGLLRRSGGPALTQPSPPEKSRVRYRLPVEPRWANFIQARIGPGRLFASPGHAFELLVGRFQDEMDFLREALKARNQRFSEAQYWRVHAHHVEAYRLVPMGPTRAGLTPKVELACYVHNDMRDWVQQRKRPQGPWDAKRPLPHALETACRIAEAAGDGPIRSAGFNFDGAALLKAYHEARTP